MGSSASKTARKLPTTTASTIRPTPPVAPTWTGARPPHLDSVSLPPPTETDGRQGGTGHMEHDQSLSGREELGRPVGKSPERFSGNKDDVVRRDALDPDFASNLSRLGQVRINNAGSFVPTPSLAQRTLQARHVESTSLDASALNSAEALPPGYLSAPMLLELLDKLKEKGADRDALYRSYRLDGPAERERVEAVRKWVNSPSVGSTDVISVDDGDQQIEMHAIWVDSPSQPPKTA